MSSRSNGQLYLPPSLLTKDSQPETPRTNCSQDPQVEAAQRFDEALTRAGLSSKEVATVLGVSDSLVNRWRSPNYRETPSFIQVCCLEMQSFSFALALHRVNSRRHGFGRAALSRLLEAAGDLATVGEW